MTTRSLVNDRLPLPAGGHLNAYLSWTERPRDWAVVSLHGLGSQRGGEKALALEAAAARRGWTFASFDFRGHGTSTGTLLELRGDSLLDDLAALRRYLASHGVRRLCLVGSSMGGWAATWFTARHPDVVPACAVIAPAFDFLRSRWSRLSEPERLAWQQTGRLRLRNDWIDTELGYGVVEDIPRFPVTELAARWIRPLLIFHGMRDDVVPYHDSLAFVERVRGPDVELRLYRDGDHRLVAYKEEMAEAACCLFARTLGAG